MEILRRGGELVQIVCLIPRSWAACGGQEGGVQERRPGGGSDHSGP